ncbi:hypothetical protein HNO89_004046 [Sporosarcina luteola]|nr:hypothetical protein [Sporosarcina luteola]
MGYIEEFRKTLPDSDLRNFEGFLTNPLLYKTKAEEFSHWELSSEDMNEISSFPNIPLIVIARDTDVAVQSWIDLGLDIPVEEAVLYEDVWRELQIDLSNLSPSGRIVIAENSDHDIYLDRPDIIIECLQSLL